MWACVPPSQRWTSSSQFQSWFRFAKLVLSSCLHLRCGSCTHYFFHHSESCSGFLNLNDLKSRWPSRERSTFSGFSFHQPSVLPSPQSSLLRWLFECLILPSSQPWSGTVIALICARRLFVAVWGLIIWFIITHMDFAFFHLHSLRVSLCGQSVSRGFAPT